MRLRRKNRDVSFSLCLLKCHVQSLGNGVGQAFHGLIHIFWSYKHAVEGWCDHFFQKFFDLGRIFTGCNVENAAFTPTSCAERTALFKAVAEGVTRFTDIAVVGARRGEVNKQITSPCGVCRQALFEFGGPELNVIMAKSPDDFIERSMDELLPFGFGPSNVAGNKAVED